MVETSQPLASGMASGSKMRSRITVSTSLPAARAKSTPSTWADEL
jgi:hypothetical protein